MRLICTAGRLEEALSPLAAIAINGHLELHAGTIRLCCGPLGSYVICRRDEEALAQADLQHVLKVLERGNVELDAVDFMRCLRSFPKETSLGLQVERIDSMPYLSIQNGDGEKQSMPCKLDQPDWSWHFAYANPSHSASVSAADVQDLCHHVAMPLRALGCPGYVAHFSPHRIIAMLGDVNLTWWWERQCVNMARGADVAIYVGRAANADVMAMTNAGSEDPVEIVRPEVPFRMPFTLKHGDILCQYDSNDRLPEVMDVRATAFAIEPVLRLTVASNEFRDVCRSVSVAVGTAPSEDQFVTVKPDAETESIIFKFQGRSSASRRAAAKNWHQSDKAQSLQVTYCSASAIRKIARLLPSDGFVQLELCEGPTPILRICYFADSVIHEVPWLRNHDRRTRDRMTLVIRLKTQIPLKSTKEVASKRKRVEARAARCVPFWLIPSR